MTTSRVETVEVSCALVAGSLSPAADIMNCHMSAYWPVYAGRWKATTVAVKIIEHYGMDAQASSSSRRVSAGREMLFATSISHPNLVRSPGNPRLLVTGDRSAHNSQSRCHCTMQLAGRAAGCRGNA